MGNDFMGQILGRALGGGALPGGGGLGGILGGMLGGGAAAPGAAGQAGARGLTAMLLPLALAWIQRSGGLGAVLQRFREKGYGPQTDSWVSKSPNQPLGPEQVREVVGNDELSQLAQQLGVDPHQVAGGLAQILPQVVDHATPDGQVTPEADHAIAQGRTTLEQALQELSAR